MYKLGLLIFDIFKYWEWGIIDDIIMYEIWYYLCKKICEKDVVGIVIFLFDNWFIFY